MNVVHNREFGKTVNTTRIEVLEAGLADLDREWRQSDVCSPYSRLYYVISGTGYVRLWDETQEKHVIRELLPGKIYLIPNGLCYDYFCEKRLEKVYVHINVVLQNGLELFSGCEGLYQIPVEEERLGLMREWMASKSPEDWLLMQGEIYRAVAEFMKVTGVAEKVTRSYSRMVTDLFALLPKMRISDSVCKAARLMNVSESTLAKTFKRETGFSIGTYRELLIMNRARMLLAMDHLSVGEIADELGFADQFYFSKYFKQRQEMSPSAYRKRYCTVKSGKL